MKPRGPVVLRTPAPHPRRAFTSPIHRWVARASSRDWVRAKGWLAQDLLR